MKEYQKTELKNHNGQLLLPRTTASVVSEEKDRQFVDGVEKRLLNKIATEEESLVTLIEKTTPLVALASKEHELLDLAEKMPGDAWGLMEDLDDLRKLVPAANRLLEISDGINPLITSSTSDNKYRMSIDDSDPENIVARFILKGDYTIEPSYYEKGDVWKVSPSAGDVELTVPVDFISSDNLSRTIKTFEEFLGLPGVSDSIKEDIINGVKEHYVEGSDTSIPQIFTSFKVKEYIDSVFSEGIYGEVDIKEKISSFALVHLAQSGANITEAKTQMYHEGNVVDPVRSSTRNELEYSIHRFSKDDWTNPSIEWLQKGRAAAVTFGDFNTRIAIAKPSLKVEIENPYKGLEIEAIRGVDPVKGFDILDWKIKDAGVLA